MNAEHYRRYAEACLKMASLMTDLNMRVAMIEVARGWSRLAEQNERGGSDAYETEHKAQHAS
jgi:hypothetical protein